MGTRSHRSISNGKRGIPLEVIYTFRTDFSKKKGVPLAVNRNIGIILWLNDKNPWQRDRDWKENKNYVQLNLECPFGFIFIKQGFVLWSPRKLIGLTHETVFLFAVCMGLCCPSVLLLDVADRMGEGCCLPCCCPQTALFGLRATLRAQENIQVKYSLIPLGDKFAFK